MNDDMLRHQPPTVVYGEDEPDKFVRASTDIAESFNQEMKRRKARKDAAPQIVTPDGASTGEMARALKAFYPALNHEQRRAIVKDSKKKGKGYTKPRKNKRKNR